MSDAPVPPKKTRAKWSDDETNRLLALREEHDSLSWSDFHQQNLFPDRAPKAVLARYYRMWTNRTSCETSRSSVDRQLILQAANSLVINQDSNNDVSTNDGDIPASGDDDDEYYYTEEEYVDNNDEEIDVETAVEHEPDSTIQTVQSSGWVAYQISPPTPSSSIPEPQSQQFLVAAPQQGPDQDTAMAYAPVQGETSSTPPDYDGGDQNTESTLSAREYEAALALVQLSERTVVFS